MSDFFTSLGNAVSNGFKNVGDAVHGEAQKMSNRTVENVKADFDEVAGGIRKNGVLGGVAASFDVATPGHQIANMADDMDLLPHDHNIKQVVAAGINMGIGAAIPGAGLLLQADALAEGFDGIGGMLKGVQLPSLPSFGGATPAPSTSTTGSAPATDGGQAPCAPSQGNVSPSDAYKARKERAIEIAKEHSIEKTAYMKGFVAGERAEARRDHAKVVITDPSFGGHGGYGAPTFSCNDGLDQSYGDMLKRMQELYGDKKTGQVHDKLDDILNDPSLSFEDKIFELMQSVMQDSQGQIGDLEKDMVSGEKGDKALRDQLDTKIGKARDALDAAVAKNPNDPNIEKLRNDLQGLTDKRSEMVQDQQDSRQQVAERVQHATEKLSEMQQSMTAILSAMHENAMNAIRNIK